MSATINQLCTYIAAFLFVTLPIYFIYGMFRPQHTWCFWKERTRKRIFATCLILFIVPVVIGGVTENKERDEQIKIEQQQQEEQEAAEKAQKAEEKKEAAQQKKEKKEKGIATKAKYQQIKEGMTYQQVVEIIGGEGDENASGKADLGNGASVSDKMYSWKGNGIPGSSMNAMFQNNKLINKAQMGLK